MADQPPNVELAPGTSENLLDENLFRFLLDLEVQRALRLQYPISVVCIAADLRPQEVDPSFTRRVARMVLRQIRATDVVTMLSQASIGLLLVDADTGALPRIHRRVKEELEAHPLTVQGRERRLTWSAGGGCYPQTATGGRDLLRQASDLMARAQGEGGDRLYLPV